MNKVGEQYFIEAEPCRIIELEHCTNVAGYRKIYEKGDIYHVFYVPSQSESIYIKKGNVDTESGSIKVTIFRGAPIKPTIELIAGAWHKWSNVQEWFQKVFGLEKLNQIKFSFNGVEISINDKNAKNWEEIYSNYRMKRKELTQIGG